jgi:hypothetical protein
LSLDVHAALSAHTSLLKQRQETWVRCFNMRLNETPSAMRALQPEKENITKKGLVEFSS